MYFINNWAQLLPLRNKSNPRLAATSGMDLLPDEASLSTYIIVYLREMRAWGNNYFPWFSMGHNLVFINVLTGTASLKSGRV